MRVRFARRAENSIRRLQPKIGRQITGKIAALRMNPYPQDSRKLKGWEGAYRVTSGEYRIIYRVQVERDSETGEDEKVLQIEAVGKRNDDEVYH